MRQMCLFTLASSLAEAGPGQAARPLSHRVISECSLLPTWGLTGFRDGPGSLSFEANCWSQEVGQGFLRGLASSWALGEMPLKHRAVISALISHVTAKQGLLLSKRSWELWGWRLIVEVKHYSQKVISLSLFPVFFFYLQKTQMITLCLSQS